MNRGRPKRIQLRPCLPRKEVLIRPSVHGVSIRYDKRERICKYRSRELICTPTRTQFSSFSNAIAVKHARLPYTHTVSSSILQSYVVKGGHRTPLGSDRTDFYRSSGTRSANTRMHTAGKLQRIGWANARRRGQGGGGVKQRLYNRKTLRIGVGRAGASLAVIPYKIIHPFFGETFAR